MKNFCFLVALSLCLLSCDSDMENIGGGFEAGRVELVKPNVYYNNVGLIEDAYRVSEVKWNDRFILVVTDKNDFLLIDREAVIADNAYTGAGVTKIDKSEVRRMSYEGTISF